LSQGQSRGTSSSGSQTTGRLRKNPIPGRREARDFVPQGTAFTNTSLEVDGSCCSSPSQLSNSSEMEPPEGQLDPSRSWSSSRGFPPAVNWNKGSKGAIRTTLRGKGLKSTTSTPTSTSFEIIEGKYWRSRSGSASTTGSRDPNTLIRGESWNKRDDLQDISLDMMTKDQIHYAAKFSDDFGSGGVSEGDDAIVLNLGLPTQPGVLEDTSRESITTSHEDPLRSASDSSNGLQSLQVIANGSNDSTQINPDSQGADPGSGKHMLTRDLPPPWPEGSKGVAFQSFALKYDPNPVTLADLSPEDLELQVKYFFYDLSSKDLNLCLPVRCIDCMKEGHLAEICPGKEVRSLIGVDSNSA